MIQTWRRSGELWLADTPPSEERGSPLTASRQAGGTL